MFYKENISYKAEGTRNILLSKRDALYPPRCSDDDDDVADLPTDL